MYPKLCCLFSAEWANHYIQVKIHFVARGYISRRYYMRIVDTWVCMVTVDSGIIWSRMGLLSFVRRLDFESYFLKRKIECLLSGIRTNTQKCGTDKKSSRCMIRVQYSMCIWAKVYTGEFTLHLALTWWKKWFFAAVTPQGPSVDILRWSGGKFVLGYPVAM